GLFSNTFDSGDAGSIEVRAGRITLTGGAEIASSTLGTGRGGEVTVMATDAISLSGQSGFTSNAFGSGDACRLFVSTPILTMDEGLIQTIANPGSSGNAGSIEVQAGRVTLTEGAQISSTTGGGGQGGNVAVAATDTLSFAGRNHQDQPSGVFSDTLSRGQG